jgi:hypothetical protein
MMKLRAALLLATVGIAASATTTTTPAPENIDRQQPGDNPEATEAPLDGEDPLSEARAAGEDVTVIRVQHIAPGVDCSGYQATDFVQMEQDYYTTLTGDTFKVEPNAILYIEAACTELTADQISILNGEAPASRKRTRRAIEKAASWSIETVLGGDTATAEAVGEQLKAAPFTTTIGGNTLSFGIVNTQTSQASALGTDLGNVLPVLRDECEQFRTAPEPEGRAAFGSGSGSEPEGKVTGGGAVAAPKSKKDKKGKGKKRQRRAKESKEAKKAAKEAKKAAKEAEQALRDAGAQAKAVSAKQAKEAGHAAKKAAKEAEHAANKAAKGAVKAAKEQARKLDKCMRDQASSLLKSSSPAKKGKAKGDAKGEKLGKKSDGPKTGKMSNMVQAQQFIERGSRSTSFRGFVAMFAASLVVTTVAVYRARKTGGYSLVDHESYEYAASAEASEHAPTEATPMLLIDV